MNNRALLLGLCFFSMVSCNDTSAVQEQKSSGQSASNVANPVSPISSADGFPKRQSAAEELVFVSSEICRPQLSNIDARPISEYQTLLINDGYQKSEGDLKKRLEAEGMSETEVFSRNAHGSNFSVLLNSNRRACLVLLHDGSDEPTFEEIRKAFLANGWLRSGIVGNSETAPLNAFQFVEADGNRIIATLREDVDLGKNVSLMVSFGTLIN